ncbi:hypothetical protein, partial [Escherichia coli]
CSEVSISPLFRWPNSVNHFISCSETMMDEHITTEENQGSNL